MIATAAGEGRTDVLAATRFTSSSSGIRRRRREWQSVGVPWTREEGSSLTRGKVSWNLGRADSSRRVGGWRERGNLPSSRSSLPVSVRLPPLLLPPPDHQPALLHLHSCKSMPLFWQPGSFPALSCCAPLARMEFARSKTDDESDDDTRTSIVSSVLTPSSRLLSLSFSLEARRQEGEGADSFRFSSISLPSSHPQVKVRVVSCMLLW